MQKIKLKLITLLYEGAEVETDTNVLNEDVRARTSPCGHDVLGRDVLDGDVLAGDVLE